MPGQDRDRPAILLRAGGPLTGPDHQRNRGNKRFGEPLGETSGPPRRRSGRAVHSRPAGHDDASPGVVISDGEGSGPCRRGEAEAQAPCTAQGRSARSGDPPPPAITAALGSSGRARPGRCLRPLPRPRLLVVGSRGRAGVCWHDARLRQSRAACPRAVPVGVAHPKRPGTVPVSVAMRNLAIDTRAGRRLSLPPGGRQHPQDHCPPVLGGLINEHAPPHDRRETSGQQPNRIFDRHKIAGSGAGGGFGSTAERR
jgi:hypothetical protein